MGFGTAHNTLANEDDENTTGASSNMNAEEANRNIQISQLNAMLQNHQLKVISGATPMNTQGQEESQKK